MNRFSRPSVNFISAAALAGCLALGLAAHAQQHLDLLSDDPALIGHTPQGYLGVDFRDVDSERASQLKLKGAVGAEIITVDHDAPACKAGMQVHDVILSMNGQAIEGEAQLRRLLRDTPPGRTVTFLISRDGQQQSITLQLADRSTIEAAAWSQHIPVPDPDDSATAPPAPLYGNSFVAGLGGNPLYTGLQLDMLGPQLANYFGVHDGQGLLVKRVDDDSPAAAAGLRAGDVIIKVNGDVVATTSQWFHTIHANRGKQVQLTVVRSGKESVVPMMAGRPKKKG
jgi:serine protease Do